jgi:hypothetical protein
MIAAVQIEGERKKEYKLERQYKRGAKMCFAGKGNQDDSEGKYKLCYQ